MSDEIDPEAIVKAMRRAPPEHTRGASTTYLNARSWAKLSIFRARLVEEKERGEAADRHAIAELQGMIRAEQTKLGRL